MNCKTSRRKCRGKKLLDIGFDNSFLKYNTKSTSQKAKCNKWEHVKLKSFCTAGETVGKVEKQPVEWEKISASHGRG